MLNDVEFREALSRLGLSQTRSCAVIGRSRRAVNGYANGKPIPEPVAKLLEHKIKARELSE